jgi:hypothetical protein
MISSGQSYEAAMDALAELRNGQAKVRNVP